MTYNGMNTGVEEDFFYAKKNKKKIERKMQKSLV